MTDGEYRRPPEGDPIYERIRDGANPHAVMNEEFEMRKPGQFIDMDLRAAADRLEREGFTREARETRRAADEARRHSFRTGQW